MTGALDIAIAAYRLAAAGGLERHALRLAEALLARGHAVTLYTTEAGSTPHGATVALIERRGLSNQGRLTAFARDLGAAAKGRHDVIVGFQKMAGLDTLFCCDWCFADRHISFFMRFMPRYRMMADLEAACFGPRAKTSLLMLAEPQAEAYRRSYPGCADRMVVLPPTLDARRMVAGIDPEARLAARRALGLTEEQTAWFWLGLQPRVKGLDRAIEALARAPDARLLACGTDPTKRLARECMALARRLGCADRVTMPGSLGEEDLRRHFLAADVLIHPARLDVTGTVIVEALGAGLPVIVTDNCGYAPHVAASGAGIVVGRDAPAAEIAAAAAVDAQTRQRWSRAALDYVRTADLTGGIPAAVAHIEAQGAALQSRTGRAV